MNLKKINLILSFVFLTNSINCGFEQVINLLKKNKKAVAVGLMVTASIYFLKKYADKLKMDDIKRCNKAIEEGSVNDLQLNNEADVKANAEVDARAKEIEEARLFEQARLERNRFVQKYSQQVKEDIDCKKENYMWMQQIFTAFLIVIPIKRQIYMLAFDFQAL